MPNRVYFNEWFGSMKDAEFSEQAAYYGVSTAGKTRAELMDLIFAEVVKKDAKMRADREARDAARAIEKANAEVADAMDKYLSAARAERKAARRGWLASLLRA